MAGDRPHAGWRSRRPGCIVGLLSGAFAGALAAAAGAPWTGALALAAALGAPLGLLGLVYDHLAERGRVRPHGMAEAALFWALALPLARLVQELLWPGTPGAPAGSRGVLPFLAFQGLMGGVYGVGFALLRARLAAPGSGSGRAAPGGR